MGEVPNELIMRMWSLAQTLEIVNKLRESHSGLKEIENMVVLVMNDELKRWKDKRKQ